MTNPFEDPDGAYMVLRNDEAQYSLWPADLSVPAGWSVVHGADRRDRCLSYIEEHWVDMRPRSLVESMANVGDAGSDGGDGSPDPAVRPA
jgi:MbtH protein